MALTTPSDSICCNCVRGRMSSCLADQDPSLRTWAFSIAQQGRSGQQSRDTRHLADFYYYWRFIYTIVGHYCDLADHIGRTPRWWCDNWNDWELATPAAMGPESYFQPCHVARTEEKNRKVLLVSDYSREKLITLVSYQRHDTTNWRELTVLELNVW